MNEGKLDLEGARDLLLDAFDTAATYIKRKLGSFWATPAPEYVGKHRDNGTEQQVRLHLGEKRLIRGVDDILAALH